MRFLNSNADMLSLDTLISNEKVRKDFRSILNEANGIIIVSGPTGSGKSTTLASALREKDSGELNIVTAEDPIEYDLGGNIQQFPVIRAKGQTFAQLLRTFLRQDPDVILIGETRDPETAESSMDAAETGHLVHHPARQQRSQLADPAHGYGSAKLQAECFLTRRTGTATATTSLSRMQC